MRPKPLMVAVSLFLLVLLPDHSVGHGDQRGLGRLLRRTPEVADRSSRKLPRRSTCLNDQLEMKGTIRRTPTMEGGRKATAMRSAKKCLQLAQMNVDLIIQNSISKMSQFLFKIREKLKPHFSLRSYRTQRRKVALRSRRKQRRAYRMAILASLAYYDFRDTKHLLTGDGNTTSYNSHDGVSWEFSLEDDPSPAEYLVKGNANSHSLLSLSWGRRRNQMLRITMRIVASFRVSLCRIHYNIARLVEHDKVIQLVPAASKLSKSFQATNATITQQCKQKLLQNHELGRRYDVQWALSNWYEQEGTLRWHDTDLIIATSGTSEIVLAFAGTASAADAVTNLQTLEPASHSGLFNQNSTASSTNMTLEGNIHRGFLNAYARVTRGNMQKLKKTPSGSTSITSLDNIFSECMVKQRRPQNYSTAVATIKQKKPDNAVRKLINNALTIKNTMRRKKTDAIRQHNIRICHSKGNSLMGILRNVTTESLNNGRTVHVVGHSLAGSLATMHALDIVINHADTPVDRLHLWTFGAPEVADSLFFESAGRMAPRLLDFVRDGARVHRYVTRSEINGDDRDPVTTITSKSLDRRGRRRLGGVRGGPVVHPVEPTSVSCNATGGELHELRSYLSGISSSLSPKHALSTDFPPPLRSWLGESLGERAIA